MPYEESKTLSLGHLVKMSRYRMALDELVRAAEDHFDPRPGQDLKIAAETFYDAYLKAKNLLEDLDDVMPKLNVKDRSLS